MKYKTCHICGSKMKKNGKTKAGTQRWRCTSCDASTVIKYNSEKTELEAFLSWLLSKETQNNMPGQGRTFRRKVEKFWKIWPIPEIVDEIHRVIFVDGIYLDKQTVILIARSEKYVLSWHLAQRETTDSWKRLLSKIAPPDMVVCDGGSGFTKAVKEVWPETAVQRCLWHVYKQVIRYTTNNPRLLPGIELRQLALELMHIETLKQAEWWVESFMNWCEFWSDFLDEKSYMDGRYDYTHERLRKARRSLVVLINKNLLFTYLDPKLTVEAPMPRHNNHIESLNRQLRDLFRNHQGMTRMHRIKATFWWCYMHTECPLSAEQLLKQCLQIKIKIS